MQGDSSGLLYAFSFHNVQHINHHPTARWRKYALMVHRKCLQDVLWIYQTDEAPSQLCSLGVAQIRTRLSDRAASYAGDDQ